MAFGLFIMGDALYAILIKTDTPLIDGSRSEMIWKTGVSFWRGIFILMMGMVFWYIFKPRKEFAMIYGALGFSVFGISNFYQGLHEIAMEKDYIMKDWMSSLVVLLVAFVVILISLISLHQLNALRQWNPGRVKVEDGKLRLEQEQASPFRRLYWKKSVHLTAEKRTDPEKGSVGLLVRLKPKLLEIPRQMKLHLEFEEEEARKAFMENLRESEGSEEGTA